MAGEFASIDYDSVGKLAYALGVIPAEIKVELRDKVREAANLIADRARQNASYSTRIPGAIYVRTGLSSTAAATVGVSATKAPEAKVMEVGNTGPGATTFRHPVFGNTDVWVNEQTRPFLYPALKEKSAEATALIAAAVREVAARHGLA